MAKLFQCGNDRWSLDFLRFKTAKEHRTCPSYGRSEKVIEQRRKTIEDQLKRTANELHQQLVKLPEWADNVQPSIDSNLLSTAIKACVEHGQKRLRAEFKHKQSILQLDANDHRLINAFYALQPNDEQVTITHISFKRILIDLSFSFEILDSFSKIDLATNR